MASTVRPIRTSAPFLLLEKVLFHPFICCNCIALIRFELGNRSNTLTFIDGIFRLERESLVHFDAARLQKLVKDGRWSAAWYYLRRFSALWEPEGKGTNQHYTSLMDSLSDDSMLAFLACRGEEGGRAASSMFPGPSTRAFPSDDAFRNKFSAKIKRYDLCYSMTSAQARYVIKSMGASAPGTTQYEEFFFGK
jgi:hypothetical protein